MEPSKLKIADNNTLTDVFDRWVEQEKDDEFNRRCVRNAQEETMKNKAIGYRDQMLDKFRTKICIPIKKNSEENAKQKNERLIEDTMLHELSRLFQTEID